MSKNPTLPLVLSSLLTIPSLTQAQTCDISHERSTLEAQVKASEMENERKFGKDFNRAFKVVATKALKTKPIHEGMRAVARDTSNFDVLNSFDGSNRDRISQSFSKKGHYDFHAQGNHFYGTISRNKIANPIPIFKGGNFDIHTSHIHKTTFPFPYDNTLKITYVDRGESNLGNAYQADRKMSSADYAQMTICGENSSGCLGTAAIDFSMDLTQLRGTNIPVKTGLSQDISLGPINEAISFLRCHNIDRITQEVQTLINERSNGLDFVRRAILSEIK